LIDNPAAGATLSHVRHDLDRFLRGLNGDKSKPKAKPTEPTPRNHQLTQRAVPRATGLQDAAPFRVLNLCKTTLKGHRKPALPSLLVNGGPQGFVPAARKLKKAAREVFDDLTGEEVGLRPRSVKGDVDIRSRSAGHVRLQWHPDLLA
jgi:hypothetical protein